MNAKKLEPKSRYAEYDTDGDGIVSDEELARHQEMLQLELQEEKADSQRKMAWVAMISMCVFALLQLAPPLHLGFSIGYAFPQSSLHYRSLFRRYGLYVQKTVRFCHDI